jgi:hypothetical protein
MTEYPAQLAKAVVKRWDTLVSGEYSAPACPSSKLLLQLLDACYLASSTTEEGRFPQFNVIAIPQGQPPTWTSQTEWLFTEPRPLSVSEIRRLAPAVDLKKSAILATWDGGTLKIAGLVDLGTSWHRARSGLAYRYDVPHALLVQVDRPGRLRIYQGQFLVAMLADGRVDREPALPMHLFLHEPVNAGLKRIAERIEWPAYEYPKESNSFSFMALWNTFGAIANSISQVGHGGMLAIVPGSRAIDATLMKLKYESKSVALQEQFIAFLSARIQ